jgi:hypothetical protein
MRYNNDPMNEDIKEPQAAPVEQPAANSAEIRTPEVETPVGEKAPEVGTDAEDIGNEGGTPTGEGTEGNADSK